MGQDERHYNINKLNFLFAIASLVLLSALGMVFLRDNDKEWRKYQTEFQTLEIEKTRVKKDAEEVKLASNGEYEELLAKLETAQAAFDQKCQFKELEKELAKLQAENEILNQQYKFSKAEMDAAKYRYETAQSHHAANLEQASTEFYALDEKTKTLNLQVEESNKKLFTKEKIIDSCGEELENLQKEKRQLVQKKNLLDRKLNKIDPQEMSFVNQMAQMVRNLPVIDLANPSLKIEQVVLQDVRDDVNFMTVPKVERCITCHLGISNPDYKDEAQPFKTHPNLELFVGNDSPHPLEEFGCTVCHGGRSRGIDFSRAAHTPASAVQKKAWIEKYDWEKLELWEEPMLPLVNVQAGCFKCHSGESTIKGADKLNLGLDVIERAGCYNCHVIDKYKDWPKTGPDLTQIASKLTPAWAYKWIADPQSFRHKTWMPSYFNQSNNSDPESKLRSQQEIHAIVHYLFAKSEAFTAEVNSLKGNPINGESLVNSVGCLACHQLKDEAQAQPETANSLRRRFGPILSGIGTKTTREWLIDWLKDPQRYHPQTRMPNLRLTDQEAADIASFLIADTNTNFASKTSPMIDDKVLNEIAFDFLKKNLPKEKATTELAAMNQQQKLLFSGEKLIGQYGCYSCHNISGFENRKPIGTELTEEGSKSLHNLDFGFIHDIDHTKEAWFTQKLKDPRIFDHGKVKAPDEKLVMPNFNLSDQETEAVVTALLGFTKDSGVEKKKVARTPDRLFKEKGQEIVAQFNCQGCHIIQDEGGAIYPTLQDWLVKYEGRDSKEAEKVHEGFNPPNLRGIGKKLDPDWLFNFLHQPTQKVRPWLKTRMPTYSFNVAHLNQLLKFFATLDDEQSTFYTEPDTNLSNDEFKAAELMFSTEVFDCTKCHVVGNKIPAASEETLAPNLALAKTRLRPDWLIQWIKDPQSLLPGTKMPTFFDPLDYENSGPPDILEGDENKQIRVLRNYLFTLSDKKNTNSSSDNSSSPAQ